MKAAFTLIELMIVIAIIAVIAAIAIPNLLESRVTSNEASAAANLRTGLLAAQTQFQAGGYIDRNNNGRGTFAGAFPFLAGNSNQSSGTAPASIDSPPSKTLALLPPQWNNQSAPVAAGTYPTPPSAYGTDHAPTSSARDRLTNVGAYNYAIFRETGDANENGAECYWGAIGIPVAAESGTYDGANGRRSFAIASGGHLLQTRGSVVYSHLNFTDVTQFGGPTALLASNPGLSNPPGGDAAAPYIR